MTADSLSTAAARLSMLIPLARSTRPASTLVNRSSQSFTGRFVRRVSSFAFGPVGTHRLEARVLLQNGRANGALRKLGAVQEGVLRRSVRRGTDYLDQVLWSVLKEDWTEHWVSTVPRVH